MMTAPHDTNTTAPAAPAEVREIPPSCEILQGHISELRIYAGDRDNPPEWFALFEADGGEYDGFKAWFGPVTFHGYKELWLRGGLCKALGVSIKRFKELEEKHAGKDAVIKSAKISAITVYADCRRKSRTIPGIFRLMDKDEMEDEMYRRGAFERELLRRKRPKDLDAEIYGDAAYAELEPLPDWDDDEKRGRGRPSVAEDKKRELLDFIRRDADNPKQSVRNVIRNVPGNTKNTTDYLREMRESGAYVVNNDGTWEVPD